VGHCAWRRGLCAQKARRFQWGQCIQRYQILLERFPLKLRRALAYYKKTIRKRRIGKYIIKRGLLLPSFIFSFIKAESKKEAKFMIVERQGILSWNCSLDALCKLDECQ